MAVAEETPDAKLEKKRSRLPLILGLVGALGGGGGVFYAVYSGLVLPEGLAGAEKSAAMPDVEFLPVDPMIITLGPGARSQHLRFGAQLEVDRGHRADVATLMPRIVDVLNGYLRAVEAREFEDPAALVRLRAQMLRRVQIVTGEGRVRDLLVTEFILN
jgi:flagellar protein FliL